MTETPSISVVIPTYNRKDSLRLTLEGLARQTYPVDRFEVIVVSDGSTDGTNEFLAAYAAPYASRPVTQPNGGPARARNRGVLEATGDVVVFLDDDVEPVPDFLALHAAHHTDSDDTVVIAPMLPDRALQGREPAWIAWEHAMLEKQYTAWRTGEWAGCGPHHFYSGNSSLRRAHLVAVGGFDEQFPRQDVELAFRLERQRGVHFVYEPAARGIHRPQRRFESWLAIPYAYGQLDVVRARRGDADWGVIRHGYHARNALTRGLARLALSAPPLSRPLRSALLLAAQTAYRLHRSGPAFAALSALYNLRYLEGARSEIGTSGEMRRLILSPAPDANRSAA